MSKRRLRQLLLLLHQYTGFIFAAYLIVVCASGTALLLLEDHITGYRDYLMLRVPIGQSKVSLTELVRSVEQANPGKTVYHILLSCERGCTYDLSMHDGADRLDALVDPQSGKILKTVVWERTPIGILYNLHGNFFYGDTGAEINGIAGLSLIVMGVTGLCLWPGWRAVARGFTLKLRGGGYRASYDVHKIVGITAVSFLLMWSVTAAGQVLWPEPPEPILSRPAAGPSLSIDKLAGIGDAALPGQLTMVYTPTHGTLVVRKRVPGDPDPYGYSYVAVDTHTGKVVQAYDVRTFPLLWRIRAAMYAIHIGAPGGIVLRLVYAVFGLAPAFLFLTAFLMWLYKLKRIEVQNERLRMGTYRHLLAVVLLFASPVTARVAQAAEQPATVPRYQPAPCPKLQGVEWLAHASCGYLVVPEDRSKPNGRTIRLMVAKYPARSPEKRPDPVLYLEGGPGDIAPLEVDGIIKANFIRNRDIWIVSQRGTWGSEPALICAATNDFAQQLLGLRFYSQATKRAHLAATQACRHELAATGAELSAYNSTESAADLADLRRVLGIAEWNLFANSYGTYMAQTLMRDHPEGIRSVVLDSVLPTTYSIPANWWNARYGFENLFNACAAEPACNATHPHLEKTFNALVNRLEAQPLTITIVDPNTSKSVKVVIDGGALVDWLRDQTYSVPALQAAPDTIAGLAAGRRDAIETIAKDRAGRAPPYHPGGPALGDGLALGVTCREDYPFATPGDLAAAGREAFPDYPASIQREGVGGWAYVNEDCGDVWNVPPAPKTMHQPVASSIPTLLISGTFDTLTSLAGAKAAAARMTHATIISIPGVGHSVSFSSRCAQAVVVSFFDTPNAPDTSCVGALKPPSFTSKFSR